MDVKSLRFGWILVVLCNRELLKVLGDCRNFESVLVDPLSPGPERGEVVSKIFWKLWNQNPVFELRNVPVKGTFKRLFHAGNITSIEVFWLQLFHSLKNADILQHYLAILPSESLP